ncbi:hypothetical protein EW026_g197 [Hermanssonia centrifuga]|uniref:Carrier domain-containing protein n=1 Tax=Hermanssonia centrifuga TaxID=98765 RepID=A0A4S4KX31_9APHY|nr:hypothetical protein EW026_g197 [Hermanssonia centrifuga]
MFGNAGQTNYASANTALAGLTKAYRNAFCMVVPIITDSAVTLNEDTSTRASRITHLTNWGMTSSELCACIEDGILKLRQDPIWQYIPNFDWNLVQENMGPSSLYAHLVSIEVTDDEVKQAQEPTSVRDVVCRVLSVASEDISMDVPLTAYGLDSLSAASLSYSLNAIVAVSQIQLLADMTLRQLEARLEVQGSPGKKAT